MLHAILNKKKIVGLYSDYEKCKIMLEGIISNNFAERKHLEIKSYYNNSITEGEYKEEIDEVESNNLLEVFTDNNTTDTDKKPENVKKVELSKEENKKKIEIQNSIFELKKQKEKLEDSKRVYDVDLELYNKFKKIKETKLDFIIPEMFTDKYELMEALEKENKLCWENFHELYKQKNMNTNYDKLFN
jgi:hypothetical protein